MRIACCLAITTVLGCSAGDDIPAPTVSAVLPDHAQPGLTVTIVGDYFCQQPETGEEDPLACGDMGIVLFGAMPATVGLYTEQMISAEVPALEPGKVGVAVAVAGRHSNTVDLTIDPL